MYRLCASLVVALLVGGPLQAQDPERPCPEVYPEARVGEYAVMRFANADGERMEIRFAIVGEEEVDGVTHYWMEVVSAPPTIGGDVIAQLLVPYYPFENSDIKGYIVKMPGQPAQRIPQELLNALGDYADPGPGWREQCDSAEDLGEEQVTVTAGTFIARHYRAGGETPGDVWIADVPFGMVKLIQVDGGMELLRFGSDAESSILEEPIDVEMPKRPPGNP